MDQGEGEFTPQPSPKEQAVAIFSKAIPIGSELPYPLPEDVRFLPKTRYKKLLTHVPLCIELVRGDLSTIVEELLDNGLPAIEIAQQMQSLYKAAGKPVRYLDEFPMDGEPNKSAKRWRELLKTIEDFTGTAIRLGVVQKEETTEDIQIARTPLREEDKQLPFVWRVHNSDDILLTVIKGGFSQEIEESAQKALAISQLRVENPNHRLTPKQELEYYQLKLEVEKEYLLYLLKHQG